MDQANNASDSTPRLVTVGVYIAYLIGAFTGVFWLLGLITAFVYREKAEEDSLVAQHLNHQVRIGIRLLIVGVVAIVAYALLVATLIGVVVAWVPFLVWWAWALLVTVKGLAALVGERAPA